MTVTINASTSSGLVQTADTSGALDLQTNGTTALGFDTSGVLSFNSGYGSAAKAYGCRAWVNFNGTGTVAIRASGNVSSITDNGTGDYTINFTTAMVDANYSAAITGHRGDSTSGPYTTQPLGTTGNAYTSLTTTSIRIQGTNSAGSVVDAVYAGVTIFR